MNAGSARDQVGFGVLGALSVGGLGVCAALLVLVFLRGASGLVVHGPAHLGALLGSFSLVGGVAALVVPLGLSGGVLLAELRGVRVVRVILRTWAGLPPVLFGVLVLAVAPAQPLLAAIVALALGAFPRLVCAVEGRVRAVPVAAREAALALGAGRWRALWDGVLPAAAPGLVSAVGRVLARSAGETAPLVAVWGGLVGLRGPDSPTALPYHLYTRALGQADAGAVNATVLLLLLLTLTLGFVPSLLLERSEERRLW